MSHASDTTTNLGDLLQEAANYTSGAHNRNNAFLWGTAGSGTGGVGAFTSTSVFNMRNNTTQTKTAQMNTANTVGDSGTMLVMNNDGDYTVSYQNGNQGAAQIQKFNLVTEAHQSVQSTGFSQGGTGASAHMSELFGYWWGDSQNNLKYTFATETESTPSGNPGWHGQQKGISSKVGKGYAGNEGSYGAGNNLRIWNYTTEVGAGTVVKPHQYSGEENFDMGQDRQYMLGCYFTGGGAFDGQFNETWKFTYATNSGVQLGASGKPTGTATGTGATGTCCPGGLIGGRSSGHGYWRD
jgi:hypothetical protein